MYATTQAFKDALRGVHTMVRKAEVIDPDGNVVVSDLKVVGGSVRADRGNNIRRRGSISLAGLDYLPGVADYDAPLHPLSGNEVKLYRGVRFGSGSTATYEYIPLGTFGIISIGVEDSGDDLSVTVELEDRGREVSIATFTDFYIVAAGTNYATAIESLIENRRTGRFNFNFPPIVAVTPQMIIEGGTDPWEKAYEMAQSVAHELFFDVDGVCVMRKAPIIGVDPVVADYEEGDSGVKFRLLDVGRTLSRQDVHNHIVVYGENTDNAAPVRGEATDSDPLSPTYVGSPVGTGDFYSAEEMRSEYVTTATQANELAAARLRQTLSIRQSAQFTTIVNPAHEPSDVITVKRGRAKVDQQYIIQSLTIPLDAGSAMNCELVEGRPA